MADQQADSVLVVEDSPRTRSRNRYLTCSASIVLMLAGAAINQFSELPGGNIVFFLDKHLNAYNHFSCLGIFY